MGHTIFPAFLSFCLLAFGQCAPSKSSFFGEMEWKAVGIDGKNIKLSELPVDLIAINVYSPDCVPCWKEIPTLNYLNKEIREKYKNQVLYLAVDPYQMVPDLASDASWGEAFGKAKVRMEKEAKDRNIELTLLFMMPPFSVNEGNFITGTPETLLLENRPLRLYYNFIGSLSEETDLDKIIKDPKVNFFKHQFGMHSK
ncbi:MAG: hypothetical protein SH817_01300 [Leptospira sp.]|nr:hypothetical protein [Leptospira sp.]